MGRVRKPPVKPEHRQEWLKRHDGGESPPKIAKSDGFDVRTVRKHIMLARREREVREANLSFLRDAMQKHHQDLCQFAEELRAVVIAEKPIPPDKREKPMWRALKEHLPRIPLWNLMVKWNNAQQILEELKEVINKRLKAEVQSDSRLAGLPKARHNDVVAFLSFVLSYHIEHWAKGLSSFKVNEHFRLVPGSEGKMRIEYGSFYLEDIEAEYSPVIKGMIIDWEISVKDWGELTNMKGLYEGLLTIKRKLKDEIDVIILRRIVPGRCRYCPI